MFTDRQYYFVSGIEKDISAVQDLYEEIVEQ